MVHSKKVQIQSKTHYFSSLVSWLTSLPLKWWLKRIISSQIVYIFFHSLTHSKGPTMLLLLRMCILWTRSLAGYSPWGRKRVEHDWATRRQQMHMYNIYICMNVCVCIRSQLWQKWKTLVWMANLLGSSKPESTGRPGHSNFFKYFLNTEQNL